MTRHNHWIFGYGSLIWRADFDWTERRPAFIRGWTRRFWQGSTDHRGLPGAPGRVVTLMGAPDEICWGMAYRIDADSRDDVMAALDFREKGGYERLQLPIHFSADDWVPGITYHATPENGNFLGDAESLDIARQIVKSAGPSGANAEYVLRLDEALVSMGASDHHVAEIARIVRQLS